MLSVIKSRKFWFSFIVPIVISTVSVLLNVITAPQYIAAVTATAMAYGATVAYEDAARHNATAAIVASSNEDNG